MSLDEDQELTYPRPAESDVEAESAPNDSKTLPLTVETFSGSVEDEPSVDCVCTICYELLVDPVTFHCGHTFCQLCVAKVRRNGVLASIPCPLCKELCQNVPSVNIQLRNIIECKYPTLTTQRKSSMTAEDKSLVDSILRAKTTELHRTSQQPVRIDIRLIKFLVIAGLIVFVLVLMFVLTMATMLTTSVETSFVTKPVNKWSPSDVAHWVGGLGDWAQQYQEIFTKQKINGPRLLLLREEKDLHTLGVEQGFPSAGFLEAIQELRQQEFYRPRNFQEYKAVHQKRVLTTAVCYKMWPRITLLYAYLFDYHDVFVPVMKPYFSALVEDRVQGGGQHLESQLQQGDTEAETEPMQFGGDTEEGTKEKVVEGEMTVAQRLVTFAAILLVPHVLVGCFAWSWVDVHPWVCFAVIAHCIVSSWGELTAVTKVIQSCNGSPKLLDAVRTLLVEFFRGSFAFLLTSLAISVVWLFIPHFAFEIVFNLILWHTVWRVFWISCRLVSGNQNRVLL